MACWQNETSLSAILYHLFIVTWCKLLMPYLTQRYDNSWCYLQNDTKSFDVAELPTMQRCSWLSVWPSYINFNVVSTSNNLLIIVKTCNTSQAERNTFVLYCFKYILIDLWVLWDRILHECYLHCMYLILSFEKMAWWWSSDWYMSSSR